VASCESLQTTKSKGLTQVDPQNVIRRIMHLLDAGLLGAAAATTGLGDSRATVSTEAVGVFGDSTATAVAFAGFEGVLVFLDSDSEPKISDAASPALANTSSEPTGLAFGLEAGSSGFFEAICAGVAAGEAETVVAGDWGVEVEAVAATVGFEGT